MTALPGVLLMHGVGDDGSCWAPFVERLCATPGLDHLQVSTPSAPAHGGQLSSPGNTVSWEDLLAAGVRHAEAFAESTGGPIVVGGHSLGSMMALGVTATRPDLTLALWLEDPPLNRPMADDREEPGPVDLTDMGSWFASLGRRPLAEVVAGARVAHPTWDEAEYEPWARAKQSVDTSAFGSSVIWIREGWARLARGVQVPTVVACGEPALGGLVSPAAEQGLADLHGWTVHRLPAGHDVRRDAPDITVALLADLIRSVSSS